MIAKHQSKIDELVQAATEGLESVDNTTAADILGAVFTLSLRTVSACLSIRPDLRDEVRKATELLMLQCADTDRPV